jgi:hypothetical protein
VYLKTNIVVFCQNILTFAKERNTNESRQQNEKRKRERKRERKRKTCSISF